MRLRTHNTVRTAALALVLLVAGGCGGSNTGAESDRTAAPTAPSLASTTPPSAPTTTTAATQADGKEPCLTTSEVASLTGAAPDAVVERPHGAKPWPSGECRYTWTALGAEARVSLEVRSDAATYYDSLVDGSRDREYTEELPSPGVGEASYMRRSTGNRSVVGLIALLYARDGSVLVSGNYSDPKLQLKPSIAETAASYAAIAKAQLAKAK